MRTACNAFRDGLSAVVPLEWLRMFDHEELQTLISGAQVPIDIGDMKEHAAYSGLVFLLYFINNVNGVSTNFNFIEQRSYFVSQFSLSSFVFNRLI